MSRTNAFAGLTEAQSEIISHWKSARGTGAVPDRTSIDPGVLRAHLSSISMVEVEESGDFRFRLIGSGMRRVLGVSAEGRSLKSLGGAAVDMVSLGLTAALERQLPVGGLIERARDRHAWLRLPLHDQVRGRMVILCHDSLLTKHANIWNEDSISSCISNKKPGLAA